VSEIHAALEELVSAGNVDPDRLGAAFGEIMDGEASPAAAAGLLMALRMKGETVEEIVSVARALRARATTAKVLDPRTVDTCGTGGSGLDTFNVSTTAAFVAAGAGASVAKHGNRAATSRSGSFDVLEALGVRIDLPIPTCAEILDRIGIAPFFARTAHPAFRHVAPVRAELGVRTLLNCLGPLLSPVAARYQVVGVYSPDLLDPLAEALGILGATRALVVHGSDGMDELTTTGPSRAALVSISGVEAFVVDPMALGLKQVGLETLRGGTPQENAATMRSVLSGQPGPARQIVELNAAAALWVVEAAESLEEGLVLARKSIDEGAAIGKLEALIQETGRASGGGTES